jgi:multicomponent K+:H+ antiporter subunit D
LFWHVRTDLPSGASGASAPLVLATSTLLALSVAMSVFAAPLQRYTQAAATQLLDRKAYFDAVLGEQGGAAARPTRPYTGQTGAAR